MNATYRHGLYEWSCDNCALTCASTSKPTAEDAVCVSCKTKSHLDQLHALVRDALRWGDQRYAELRKLERYVGNLENDLREREAEVAQLRAQLAQVVRAPEADQ